MCGILLVWLLLLARPRLSDSGEDAKVEGTRKVGWARKRKKEGTSSRFIFVFALSQFSISEPGTGYLLSATVFFSQSVYTCSQTDSLMARDCSR